MDGNFFIKTKIIFGRDSIERLSADGEKAVIFSSNSMLKYGFTNEVIDAINMSYFLIKDIKPEPEEKEIGKYVEVLEKQKPDVIVAIGGGSVIDTAKAALYHYKKAKLVAIPSTSGSGSEVTMASVISKNGLKYSIFAKHIAPSLAILDPRLPEKMPSSLAAITGMDALTHAIESYVSRISSPFSKAYSIKAIKDIFEYLPESVNRGGEAREKIHYAACMSGIAISNARVGICHVMAHKLGIFNIPHGLAVALLLEETIKFNMQNKKARKEYDMIAKEIGLKNGDELIEKIKELKKKIGIKEMREYVKEEEYEDKIELMASMASDDKLLDFNPVKAGEEEIKEIYRKAYGCS
ncbi:MAG: iron-containing alcohol dehydrogenase [Thermoplasmata archaeon]|nr:MAG: iron-containing alcohol dehydrogenase [Thermoplasmata archaeon]